MTPSRRGVLVTAAVLGALAVAAGAFAAHGLSSRVSPRMLEVWETAARYQMWHVLALLAVAASEPLWKHRAAAIACAAWIAGIVLFSGSLYALVLTRVRALGAVTPVGGALLMAGWVLIAVAAWRGGRR